MYMFVCMFFSKIFFFFFFFLCKTASNVGPYGLFWQLALVRYASTLYLCLLIGQIKMLACLLDERDRSGPVPLSRRQSDR